MNVSGEGGQEGSGLIGRCEADERAQNQGGWMLPGG